ncbi:MAG: glycosyltransferase family 4 protein [Anaerolineales bacterium]|jgi:glycosyltransferase involved in cell wall biosynthesis
MRILFLSNYYPPFAQGGYEQWCKEVATELSDRGHEVRVLTSRFTNGNAQLDGDNLLIHRTLYLELEGGLLQTAMRQLLYRQMLEQKNLDMTRRIVEDFQPDLAFVWGMWNVPRSIPALVERLLPGRVVYYLCDYWPSLPSAYEQRWRTTSNRGSMHWLKKLVGRYYLANLTQETHLELELNYPICVSHAVKDLLVEACIPIRHAQIIYGGTQVEEFAVASSERKFRKGNTPLKLIYAGRLSEEKGVFTAAGAMKLLKERYKTEITLDVFGDGDPHYVSQLKEFIRAQNNGKNINFRGRVAHHDMPNILTQYDSLVFPSKWEEPFARIVLEAMASGLVVIGTTTGGTKEILVEGETGLTFPAGDAQVLASQIERLYHDTQFGLSLANSSQELVRSEFSFTHMVDQLESALVKISSNS